MQRKALKEKEKKKLDLKLLKQNFDGKKDTKQWNNNNLVEPEINKRLPPRGNESKKRFIDQIKQTEKD